MRVVPQVPRDERRVRWLLPSVMAAVIVVVAPGRAPASGVAWDPAAIAKEDIIKLRTVGSDEGEYWFPVWVVVIDQQVFVRLGTRAAERVQRNTKAPYLGVEIEGKRFEHVRGESAPEYAERVADAMADKYTADLLIRWMSHPVTLRLAPE